MTAGVCKYCGCTETNPCVYGCAWTDDTRTLCSVCGDAVDTARVLVEAAGVSVQTTGLRLVTTHFDKLPLERQALLVKATREIVDSIRDGIAQAMNEEAIEAVRQVDRLSGFLLEQCSDQVGEDDTAVDVAIRLLTPHVGSCIVLPAGSVRP